jgi:hypothetical protein
MALVVPRPTSSSDQFPAYPIINWMSPLLIWIAKRESKVNEFVDRGIHGLFFLRITDFSLHLCLSTIFLRELCLSTMILEHRHTSTGVIF